MSTPLDVCLLSPGLPHRGDTLGKQSLGGSETAAINVARELAKRGHHVTAFSPCPDGGGVFDGVTYIPIEHAQAYCIATPHDVLVISRAAEFARLATASKLRVLWCHDLAHKRNRPILGTVAYNLDALYVMSEYQRKQYEQVVGMLVPPSTLHVTRNGTDFSEFPRVADRDRNALIYGSRPERGLSRVLDIMDELRRRGSSLYVKVSWYDNPQDANVQSLHQQLLQRMQGMPNVKVLGSLKQRDWKRELATSFLSLYPGTPGAFREISCIAAIESMVAGTPVLALAKGALPETLGGPDGPAGVLLGDDNSDAGDPVWIERFADEIMRLHADDVAWQRLHLRAMEYGGRFSWAQIAEEWEADWMRRFESYTGDAWRMRRHFERVGDVEAAGA